MYKSNVHKDRILPPKKGNVINILLGNSADPSNNHQEMLEKLLPYKNENMAIYCPLSYGVRDYAVQIEKLGGELFGDKFKPLLEFMPFDKYIALLGQIDIAVFAHKRQQAMGNTFTLLGLGKKVFMRSTVTPWKALQDLGIQVFDVEQLDISPLSPELAEMNYKIISTQFSEQNLVTQLKKLFGEE